MENSSRKKNHSEVLKDNYRNKVNKNKVNKH